MNLERLEQRLSEAVERGEISEQEARNNWTAKHYQSVTKDKSSEIAQAIILSTCRMKK